MSKDGVSGDIANQSFRESSRLPSGLPKAEPDYRLVLALEKMIKLSDEVLGLWDSDQDMKVGKMLMAMSGRLPGYRADIKEIHDLMDEAKAWKRS